METVTTYKDRDNTFVITFKKNWVLLTEDEMLAITKIELRYKDQYYNSVDHSQGFEIDSANSQVTIKPYSFNLTAGTDTVEVIIYDSENQNGLVWDQFQWTHSPDASLP